MRVLEVTHRYRPRVGGVETHVEAISTRLAARGHDVMVVAADRRPGEPVHQILDNVDVYRHVSFRPGGNAHLNPMFPLGVSRAEADVVHAHNYHSFPGPLAVLGSGDKRSVFTTHYHRSGSTGLTDALMAPYSAIAGRAVRAADEIIAVSEREAGMLSDDFGVNARTIGHGMNYDSVDTSSPARVGGDYALVVGRLDGYKNVRSVIRALPETDLELVVVGEGPDLRELRRTACWMGMDDRVHFMGHVDDGLLNDLYAGAEVMVNVSEHEAFGMVVGEALARGAPVVVNSGSGLSHWVDTDGVVGVRDLDPVNLGCAVATAVGLDVDDRPLPDWDDVADETERLLQS